MSKVINCECGRSIRGESEDDVVAQAQDHIRESHPDLVDSISREQLYEWVQDE